MNSFTAPKTRQKKIALIIVSIVTIISVTFYFTMVKKPYHNPIKIDGLFLNPPQVINDFQLTDNTGQLFDKKRLEGRWTLMFFGFTNCGMVCPATMAALNKMYHLLQQDLSTKQLPQIVMVSVDPDRDSIAKMNSYVKTFNPNFMGVRGDIARTVALEKQLHIAAAKFSADGKGKNHYMINHTTDILVFNPQAQLQAFLAFPHQAEQMVNDFKAIVKVS